jgi:hypothetical protein
MKQSLLFNRSFRENGNHDSTHDTPQNESCISTAPSGFQQTVAQAFNSRSGIFKARNSWTVLRVRRVVGRSRAVARIR